MCATLSSLAAKVDEQLYLSSTTRLSTNFYTDKDSTSPRRHRRNLKQTPSGTTTSTSLVENQRRALISHVYESDFDDTEDESYLISLQTIEDSPYTFAKPTMFRPPLQQQNQRSTRADNDSDYGSDDEGRFKERIIIPSLYKREEEERTTFVTPRDQIEDDEYNSTLLTPTKYKTGENFSASPLRPERTPNRYDDDDVRRRPQPETPARRPTADGQRQSYRPQPPRNDSPPPPTDHRVDSSRTKKPATKPYLNDNSDDDVPSNRAPLNPTGKPATKPYPDDNSDEDVPSNRAPLNPTKKPATKPYPDDNSDEDVPNNRTPLNPTGKPATKPYPDDNSDEDVPSNRPPGNSTHPFTHANDAYSPHQSSSRNGSSSRPIGQRIDASPSRKPHDHRYDNGDRFDDPNYSTFSPTSQKPREDAVHQENIALSGRTHVLNGQIEFKPVSVQLQPNDDGSHQSQVELIFRTKLTGAQVRELVGQTYGRVGERGSNGQVLPERSPVQSPPQRGRQPTRELSDSDVDEKSNYQRRQPVVSQHGDTDSDVDKPHSPSKPSQPTHLTTDTRQDQYVGRTESIGRRPEDRRPPFDRAPLVNQKIDPDAGTPSLDTTFVRESRPDKNAYNFGSAKEPLEGDDEFECIVLGRSSEPRSRRDQFAEDRYKNPTTTTTNPSFGTEIERATETDHYGRPSGREDSRYQAPLSAGVAEREQLRGDSQLGGQGSYGGYSTSYGRLDRQAASREFDEPHDRAPVSYTHQQAANDYDSESSEDAPVSAARRSPAPVDPYDTYEVDPDSRSDYRPSSEYSRTQPVGLHGLVTGNPIHRAPNTDTQSQDSRLTTSARPGSKLSKAEKKAEDKRMKAEKEEAEKKRKKEEKKAREERKKRENDSKKKS